MGILKSCPRVPRTSERLGEMFKGGSADTYAGKFLHVSMGGQSDTSNMQRGSGDPHWRERKFLSNLSKCCTTGNSSQTVSWFCSLNDQKFRKLHGFKKLVN